MPLSQTLTARQRKARRFHQLARKYEDLAIENPRRHKRFVLRMIAISYIYIAVVLGLFLPLFVVCVVAMLRNPRLLYLSGLLSFGFMCAAIVRALWIRIPQPNWASLSRSDAPGLWQMVDEIAGRLQAPLPASIFLTLDLNASAMQHPRFGVFGGYRNFLVIGARLLFALSESELRSTIAHEFGHFSNQHGRLGMWIYRVRRKWELLIATTDDRILSAWPIRLFGKWWLFRFSASTAALVRQCEYQADADAVRIAGASAVGSKLCRLMVIQDWLLLPDENRPAPEPVGVVGHLRRHFLRDVAIFRAPLDRPRVSELLGRALRWSSGGTESHPALVDRLRAIGIDPEQDFDRLVADVVEPREPSAATLLFDGLPEQMADVVEGALLRDREREDSDDERARQEEHGVATLAELERKYVAGELDPNEKNLLIAHRYVARRRVDAEALARELLQEDSDNYHARLLLATLLLERLDPEGEAHAEICIATSGDLTVKAFEILANYWRQQGRRDRFEEVQQRHTDWIALDEAVLADAGHIKCRSRLSATVLSAWNAKAIRRAAPLVPGTSRVYAALHESPYMKTKRLTLYVFANRSMFAGSYDRAELSSQLSQYIRIDRGYAIVAPKNGRKWRRVLDTIPGALVYDG